MKTGSMPALGDTCKRCKKEPTTLASRNDTFCENCFIRFIRGKQRKQMQDEKFKVKFNDRAAKVRILLDMNDNHQSYVLLDILVSMLSEQLTQGPKAIRGFDLVICLINDGTPVDVSKIENFYTPAEITRLGLEFARIECDTYIQHNDLQRFQLDTQTLQMFALPDTGIRENVLTYQQLLGQISDKSTREDLSSIIHEDILIQTAKDQNCTVLIKSDSMTQIAVEILSDTIRGRGSEIPFKSQDSSVGDLEIIHPLREVLNSEVKMYSEARSLNCLSSTLQDTKPVSDVSTRNKTVGQMVNEYFTSLEVEYPETVSTVVKIGAKLDNPADSQFSRHCEICKVPIYHDPKKWLEQITVPESVPPQSEEEFANLQRYLDSTGNNSNQIQCHGESKQPEEVKLCYGCMVSLGVSNITDMWWPRRPTKEEIVSEYVLDDSEDNN